MSRNEAERLLEYLDNKPGMFLIRDSETHSGKLVLSLLDYDEKRSLFTRHYKIEKHPNSKFSVVGVRNPTLFDTLDDLVEYYQSNIFYIIFMRNIDMLTLFDFLENFILKRKLTKPCLKEKKFAGIHDVWEEDRENIQLMKKLAEGNFGEVYLGLWRNKHTVAVKTLKKKSNHTLREAELSQQEFFRELELMKLIRHEKVVKLWCVCTRDEPVYLVTEFMCNGSLLDYLRKEQKNLNLKTLIDMASQIASGMRYLELNSYVHRDLAARNVLVGERNVCKIADFGLTKKIGSEKDSTGKPALPVKWTAPEVFTSYLQGNFSYDIKADVWSFGILLFEVITFGGVPYAGMTNNEILNKVQEGYRIPKPKGLCSNDYYDIMLKCWNKDPESRPTFDSLFNIFSDFFINIETKYVRND